MNRSSAHSWPTCRLVLLLGLAIAQTISAASPARSRLKKGLGTVTNFQDAPLPATLDPAWRQRPAPPYQLGPGDQIELELPGIAGTRTQTFVGPDGRIYFDLLPGQDVWGLTLEEAQALLEKGLTEYVLRPQVSVKLRAVQSRRVRVAGQVNQPGAYPLTQPMTLREAIAAAGGWAGSNPSDTAAQPADLPRSFLLRQGALVPVNFVKLLRDNDPTQDLYLRPDDFLYLAPSLPKEISVLGAVSLPQALSFTDQTTLFTAIGSAGGPLPNADLGQVILVRGPILEARFATIDFARIQQGQLQDLKLEPHDLVYLPTFPSPSPRDCVQQALTLQARILFATAP